MFSLLTAGGVSLHMLQQHVKNDGNSLLSQGFKTLWHKSCWLPFTGLEKERSSINMMLGRGSGMTLWDTAFTSPSNFLSPTSPVLSIFLSYLLSFRLIPPQLFLPFVSPLFPSPSIYFYIFCLLSSSLLLLPLLISSSVLVFTVF